MLRRPAFLIAVVALLAGLLPGRADAREPWGTGQSRPEDLQVYLVTFGPGPSVESWFGHTALVVEDPRLGVQRLYNYGMFSFGNDMLVKFAMGRLEFWVDGESRVQAVYRYYASENRDVIVDRLNLEPAQKASIAQALSDNVLPENRNYLYHHYFDNCATRPRDMIDRAVGGALHEVGKAPGRMTLREHTRRHSDYFPPLSVLLDFLMNDEIDKPIARWDEAFLPAELEKLVEDTKVANGQPLVAERNVWFKATRPLPPPVAPNYSPWMFLMALGFGGLGVVYALWHRKSQSRLSRFVLGMHHATPGLVFGLPGTVLLIMWMITNHTVTWRNENLLLANPVTLATLPLGVMLAFGSQRAARWLRSAWLFLSATGVLAIAVKVLPMFDQDNWRLILFILPVSLGMAAASVILAPLPLKSRSAAPAPAR